MLFHTLSRPPIDLSIIDRLNGDFTFVRPKDVGFKFPFLHGIGLFHLKPRDGMLIHSDINLLGSSRYTALNILVDGDCTIEWWTAREPEVVVSRVPGYSYHKFPEDKNEMILSLPFTGTALIDVETPHRGYSSNGGRLISLGFTQRLDVMRKLLG